MTRTATHKKISFSIQFRRAFNGVAFRLTDKSVASAPTEVIHANQTTAGAYKFA